jgi:hypothetical protein
MKWRKIVLPTLIGLAVALGPVFLPDAPQALAAQAKESAQAKPVEQAAKPKAVKKTKPAVKTKTVTKAKKVAKKKTAKKAAVGNNFTLCRSHATVRVHGGNRTYLVKNDNFMDRGECLSGSYTKPAFRVSVSRATATGPDSDAMPDIFTGCAWGSCSPRTNLPAKVPAVGNEVTTFQTTEHAAGTWAASYDVWFDPRPIRNGQAATEMMIWLNGQNVYNPAGHGWPIVRIDGALWYVETWITGNGRQTWRYVQFRKYTARWSVTDMALKPFFQYLEGQGWITPSWYVLNVEAGFEIWNGGAGLATTAFSAT